VVEHSIAPVPAQHEFVKPCTGPSVPHCVQQPEGQPGGGALFRHDSGLEHQFQFQPSEAQVRDARFRHHVQHRRKRRYARVFAADTLHLLISHLGPVSFVESKHVLDPFVVSFISNLASNTQL